MRDPGRPLSVLHIIETLGRGGAEVCLTAGLPALLPLGVRPAVLVLGRPLDLAPELEKHGIPVLPAWEPRSLARARSLFPFDLVHTHLFRANIAGRALSLALRCPVVTSLHNPDYSFEGPGRFGLRLRLDRLSARLTSPGLLSVSQVVKEDFERHLGRSSVLIPNPVDLRWLDDLPSRQEARRQLGLDDRPVVLTLARLHPQKGLDVLAEVARRRPKVQFVVAGQGPERERLSALGSLRLVGVLQRPELRLWLAAADAAALPSRWESFGVAAIEKMGAGLPLVVSDIAGLGDTVGEAALRVPPEDVPALGDAIDRVLRDQELRQRLVAQGRAQAALFAPSRWAERVVASLYRPLLRAG